MTLNLRRVLHQAWNSANPRESLNRYTFKGLSKEFIHELPSESFYQGKVRQCVSLGGCLHILHTDNLSAFDRFITHLPFKGALLSLISKFWFERLGGHMPHAYQSAPHERILTMRRLKPLKVEVIVRAYLAGSMQRSYRLGDRKFCGQSLAEGLKDYAQLPRPLLTPTSKAEVGEHDEPVTPDQLIEKGVLTSRQWSEITSIAQELFKIGTEEYGKLGWILADTKYEFGEDDQGKVYLIDEVHTPDSSRLWEKSSYDLRMSQNKAPAMFDKEIVRQYLLSQGFAGDGAIPPIPFELLQTLLVSYLEIVEGLLQSPLELSQHENMETYMKESIFMT